MREGELPTCMIVAAQIRAAGAQGVTMTLVHKGGEGASALCVKVCRLDGTAHVFSQVNDGARRAWFCPLGEAPLPEREADAYLSAQADFDPDLWIVEVEDKQGRNWFEGD